MYRSLAVLVVAEGFHRQGQQSWPLFGEHGRDLPLGVRLWLVGQDLEQFERVYPDSWGSFISGAQAVQFMGIVHPPTVAWLAERLGQHVVVNYQKTGREVQAVPSERALRDPDQIARMLSPKKKNQIIWRGNESPHVVNITPD